MSATNSLTSPSIQSSEEEIKRKLIPKLPQCPFGDMALALSGGGFRAAAFSLGAISYLNSSWYKNEEDTLLKHITFLTSTSGGTITNAFYSVSIFKQNFQFKTFYKTLKDFMDGDAVLKEAIDILNDPSRWNEVGYREEVEDGKIKKTKFEKSYNLINSFAKAYDNKLFNASGKAGENLYGVFFDRSQNPHLKTVCFNTTELNNGISFRFQTNGDPASIFTVGNYYLQFNDAETAKKLKISDMLAASSCFPSGFEPIIYPTDYIHPGLTDVDKMLKALNYKNNNPLNFTDIFQKPFCMVDGGVVDNQGLFSMMMEDNFRAEHTPEKQFDLMIVCDVSSYFNDAFITPPENNEWWRCLTVNKLSALFPIGVFIFIASVLLSSLAVGLLYRIGLFFLLTSGIYTALYLYGLFKFCCLRSSLNNNSWGKVLNRYLGNFFSIRFKRLQQMLSTRIKSTIIITTDLFLKQIRRQYYGEFYNMPAYKDRTLSCLIYEFSKQHDANRTENLKIKDKDWWPQQANVLQPSDRMQTIATDATNMATTLWFDDATGEKQVMRDKIIACGQFTMCYNLLKHIYRLEVLDNKWATDNDLQGLKQRLLADWWMFRRNPSFMV